MNTLLFLAGLFAAWMSFTFVSYCAVTKLKDIRDDGKLNWKIQALSYPALLPMFLIYWGLNVVIASILFLDIPKELAFTKRCQRYISEGKGWRAKQALWWCKNVLNPVERDGQHC